MVRKIAAVLVVLTPLLTFAQKNNDADKQKITEIEQTFVSIPNFSSPEMTNALQKYLYDGTTTSIGQFGRLFHMSKSQVVEMSKKPDPTDPDAKGVGKLSDVQVDVFGDAATASYKQTNTESGHKEAALNGEYSLSCLDSFVKRKGQWYIVGNACVPAAPLSQAQWDAVMKMRSEEKPQ
jgi:hypothetical protein